MTAPAIQLHPSDRATLLSAATDSSGFELPFVITTISCGFPSPAADYAEERLNLIKRLVKNPTSTFFAQAHGDSNVDAGILDGAILVVDRSLAPRHGDIVLASVDDEFTCKRLYIKPDGRIRLVPASSDKRYRAIDPGDGQVVTIFGVVTAAVNEFRKG